MTAGAPRTGAGIESQARELVEDLARRSGLSAAELLRRLAAEEGPEDVSSQDFFTTSEKSPYFERARAGADAPARIEALGHPADELQNMTGALDRLTDRIEAAENRSTVAIGGIEKSVQQVISRLDEVEREQVAVASRFEGAVHELTNEQGRNAERVRRVESEAAGPRSAEAVRALEGSLGKIATHLYEGESRTQQVLGALRQRLDQIEADRPADPSALMDEVVARVTQRLEHAESRTTGAIRDLQGAFAALDDRVKTVEGASTQGVEQRFEALAASLATQVEAARAEMVEKIRSANLAGARYDQVDRKIAEIQSSVLAAEQRSAAALERMGRDVLSVAETLGRKVTAVENRHADAVEQLGGEVSRIAVGMEAKLNRTDQIQAAALEKLGNEIARITERLSERVANAERRAAQAIDDVGEQVTRVTERLNARSDRASSELADRIRQSEERTARMLEDARERMDQRLAEAQRLAAEAIQRPLEASYAPTPPAGFPSRGFANQDFSPFSNDPFGAFEPAPPPREAGDDPFSAWPEVARPLDPVRPAPSPAAPAPVAAIPAAATPEPVTFAPEPAPEPEAFVPPEPITFIAPEPVPAPPSRAFGAPLETPVEIQLPEASTVPSTTTPEPPSFQALDEPFPSAHRFSQADFDAADARAVQAHHAESEADPADDSALVAPSSYFVEQPLKPDSLATSASWPAAVANEEPFGTAPLSTREIIERARASARAAAQPAPRPLRSAGSESPPPAAPVVARKPRRTSNNVQNVLLVTGLMSGFVGGVVGLQYIEQRPSGHQPSRYAAMLNVWRNTPQTQVAETDTTPAPTIPHVAVALAPTAVAPGAATATPEAAPAAAHGPVGADLYAMALSGMRAGAPTALTALRRAASLGYPPAQFYLATLYSEGRNGVPRDAAQARIWTERAAHGGDRWAMHNLALNYYEGVGGHADPVSAAQWFRRAADLGLVDSQYNMGRLYETGVGVTQNPAEAYKWYLIAARSGDADSRASASRVRAGLSAQARSSAEASAAAYRPTAVEPLAAPPPSVTGSLNPQVVMVAQRALARLRYLQGPSDGVVTPALTAALGAFQRDHALPQTGLLDTATQAALAQ
jgi:localization factor PodJL